MMPQASASRESHARRARNRWHAAIAVGGTGAWSTADSCAAGAQ